MFGRQHPQQPQQQRGPHTQGSGPIPYFQMPPAGIDPAAMHYGTGEGLGAALLRMFPQLHQAVYPLQGAPSPMMGMQGPPQPQSLHYFTPGPNAIRNASQNYNWGSD